MKVIKQEEDVVESRTIGWVSGGPLLPWLAGWLCRKPEKKERKFQGS